MYYARFALPVINVFSLREITAQQGIRFSGASSLRPRRLDRITAVGTGNLDDEARAELLYYSQASQRVYRRHRESFRSWSGIPQGRATAGMKSTARHVSSKPIDGGGLLDLFDDIAGTGGSFQICVAN
jgi:hypothetical protein